MTDPYNTAPFEDRQSKNVLNDVVAGGLVDSALKVRSSQNKLKPASGKSEEHAHKSKLYKEGIKHFRDRGIFLTVDRTGVHCGHHVYMHKSPPSVKGINYGGNFMPKMPLINMEDFARLETAVNSMGQVQKDFWDPIINPRSDSELSRYVERLIAMEKIGNNYSAQEPKNLYQTHDPSPNGVFGKASDNPMTWIPPKEWFSENIRNNLRFEDVFTIFPPAEIDIIKLWLGRVAVGPSNHIPDNHDTPIRHTARMGIVIVGKNAGLGKSTMFNYLLNALNKCGHSTTTFKSVQDKFGLKNGALSSVLYKDKSLSPQWVTIG